MNTQNAKALIVSFYLSKYDKAAYQNLDFGNSTQTHTKIGEILNVNPNSIKNMRDEYDPYHPNKRAGWYQRPLRPSRQKVFTNFSDLTETALRVIVLDILNEKHDESLIPVIEKISGSNEDEEFHGDGSIYTSRGITGEKAEKYFEEHWKEYYPDFSQIYNKTKDGCGYDYRLTDSEKNEKIIEVKGMKNTSGGILLTSKEWEVAINKTSRFDLFIVSNIDELPAVKIIPDPSRTLTPKKQVQTVVQVNWTLSCKQINET